MLSYKLVPLGTVFANPVTIIVYIMLMHIFIKICVHSYSIYVLFVVLVLPTSTDPFHLCSLHDDSQGSMSGPCVINL